jgi:hypothetical protein
MPSARAERLEPLEVALTVVADGSQHERIAAERAQRVGDVAGAAAPLAPHRRHQERHVQDVHLVGQDGFREAPRIGGDGVEGERAADQGRHVKGSGSEKRVQG